MHPVTVGMRYGLNLLTMVARQQGYPKAMAVSGLFVAREISKLPKAALLSRRPRISPRPAQAAFTVYSEGILADLATLGVERQDLALDGEAYREHVATVAYPRYYAAGPVAQGGAREKKLLEYFVSLVVLKPQAKDVVIDVASEYSIFPDVLRQLVGATVYRQDLIYPAGVKGDRIGGSAVDMPIPAAFADQLVLHNAFEHFEGSADTDFIREAWRVLKPGGRLCILPLYMSDQHSIFTDPLVDRRGIAWDTGARVIETPWFHNRFGRFYDAEALQRRVLAPAREAGFRVTIVHVVNVRQVVPESRLHFCLLLTKRD
jgi:SAM-dependent methyltransferase